MGGGKGSKWSGLPTVGVKWGGESKLVGPEARVASRPPLGAIFGHFEPFWALFGHSGEGRPMQNPAKSLICHKMVKLGTLGLEGETPSWRRRSPHAMADALDAQPQSIGGVSWNGPLVIARGGNKAARFARHSRGIARHGALFDLFG